MEKVGLTIFSDGGARGNPGPGACAFVAKKGNRTLSQGSKYLGKVTNNVAEYSGVILALNWLVDNLQSVGNSEPTIFFMDSELVVSQINGVYKIKNLTLRKLHQGIVETITKNGFQTTFKYIPRSKNKVADFLVNQELDKSAVL